MITITLTDEQAQYVKEGLAMFRRSHSDAVTMCYDAEQVVKRISDLEDVAYQERRNLAAIAALAAREEAELEAELRRDGGADGR
jgi:hypothetical protein